MGSNEKCVSAGVSQAGQGMAGGRLTERETIRRVGNCAKFVYSLEKREQVEVKAAQIEHDAAPAFS